MEAHIICPFQVTETFDMKVCVDCKHLEVTTGGAHSGAIRCRRQRTTKQKKDWEMAFYERRVGLPISSRCKIVVDSTK